MSTVRTRSRVCTTIRRFHTFAPIFWGVFLACCCVGSAAHEITSVAEFEREGRNGQLAVIVALKVPASLKTNVANSAGDWVNINEHLNAIQSQAIKDFGWRNVNDVVQYRTQPTLAKAVSKKELKALLRSRRVEAVYKDGFKTLSLAESTGMIGVPLLPDNVTGESASVAVIDSGVDATHPFLRRRVVAEACFSFASSCPNGQTLAVGPGMGRPCPSDGCEHGTHVAGIIAGSTVGQQGVAPSSNIVSLQVFSETDGGLVARDSDILQALEWVYLNSESYEIKAINLSLGGGAFAGHCDMLVPYKRLFDLLQTKNIATVVASGNEYFVGSITSPACISSAISVGSVEKDKTVSEFSNTYERLSLLAPGGDISSSVPGGGFAALSGTSMATPHVAGAWALLASAFPSAGYKQLRQAITESGELMIDPRDANAYHLLDVPAAYKRLQQVMHVPNPPPEPGPGDTKPQPQPAPKPKPDQHQNPQPPSKRIDGILIERRSESDGGIRW